MSSVETTESALAADQGDLDAPARGRQHKAARAVVALTLVAALAVGAVIGFRWMTGLRVFTAYGNGVGATLPALGGSIYAGGFDTTEYVAGRTLDETIVIDSATPVLAANSGPAKTRLLVGRCGVGAGDDAMVRDLCGPVVNVVGKKWRVDQSAGQLIAQVTPTSMTPVRVQGFIIKYHEGMRSGTQHVGTEIGIKVR